ncbi:retrovirus-related pol polyprotein from transposon TNT 1-94 [Tanacetum coccineum]
MDHGKEFYNDVQIGEFFNANGITHNFSASRTLQSKRVVESKNRSLQEMSRTMLNEQLLPQKFWCNAVDTSTYILNRILIRAILGKTPYELLRGRKPTLDYFKVFGSKCFILTTKDYLTKFDPKSYKEPKNVNEALKDESWIIAMQEELNQFITNDVWELVPHPKSTTIIGTKWVYRNKLDENCIVSQNKVRLVAQGYNQQEGIDYDETYALVSRLESIRILLAYACALDFKLFQMDVKSAFLNGFINEEVTIPRVTASDHKNTHVYILKISNEYTPPLRYRFEFIEDHHIHEVRVVDPNFVDMVYHDSIFGMIGFNCQMLVKFDIQNKLFSLTLEEFGQILRIPIEGQCSIFEKWSLANLEFSVPSSSPYRTTPPTPDEIKLFVQVEREEPLTCIRHSQTIDVDENQILTREIKPIMKTWVELICKNVFCLGGNRIVTPPKSGRSGMTRKDYGTKRGRPSTFTFFSSAFDHPSSSHHIDDYNDENDEATSRTRTHYLIRYVNSFSNEIP